MIVFPNAKINLGLYIVAKRSDGFHDLESIFYPVPGLKDALEAVPSRNLSFVEEGIKTTEFEEDNLCMKAFRLLEERHHITPVDMHLLKGIPVGAGLGGGSSDATFALKLISDLHALALTDHQLKTYAAELGSDCPFFVDNKPAYVHGRGEMMESLEDQFLSGLYISILYPGTHISTREAFSGIMPRPSDRQLKTERAQSDADFARIYVNDFEENAFSRHPEIAFCKQWLLTSGCFYASMTGSGSAVYGLSHQAIEIADKAAHWFYYQGKLD